MAPGNFLVQTKPVSTNFCMLFGKIYFHVQIKHVVGTHWACLIATRRNVLTLLVISDLLSADNLYKQFVPRLVPTESRS